MKIVLGVLAVAVVGFGYVALSPSEVESTESISKAAEIPTTPTGELRLFDEIGTFFICCIQYFCTSTVKIRSLGIFVFLFRHAGINKKYMYLSFQCHLSSMTLMIFNALLF